MIQVHNLSVTLNDNRLLHNINFQLNPGDWLMIVGPNGAGKSSLIKAIAGNYPYQGLVTINDQDLRLISPREKARHIGFLMQQQGTEYDFTVEEVVSLGRYPYHTGLFRQLDARDASAIDDAIQITGLSTYRNTSIRRLSGGEVQRVFLAQLLAQDPDILILDEPTNHLDIIYEQTIFHLVQQWLQQPGKAIITIVHDLSLAKLYGTHALVLNDGQVVENGPVQSTLTPSVLNKIYHLDVPDYMNKKYQVWAN